MKIAGRPVGLDQPFFLLAGPCAIESQQLALDTAGQLKEICAELDIPFVYKSSFDKANRSSGKSFRGPGLEGGLKVLAEVKRQIGVPVVTDVHEIDQIQPVAEVVDVLQTPAFLCRQTDFINAVAASGRPVNIKKGQFLAPHDMMQVVAKARAAARDAGVDEDCVMVCERGASFGYNNLVSDMRSLAIMRETGCPVVFMPPTRCSCRAGRATAPVASANSSPYSHGPPWPPAWPASSWKPTPIRNMHCPTAPMPGRWPACATCWPR